MLTIGIKGRAEADVTESNTALTMGSGGLPVFATPSMVALMESAADKSVLPFLAEGQGTVGTLMHVKHMAASPLNMKIEAQSELIEIDGRRLVFRVTASDNAELIGEGVHERFIIDTGRFMQKALQKKA